MTVTWNVGVGDIGSTAIVVWVCCGDWSIELVCDCDGGDIASANVPKTIKDARNILMIFIVILLEGLYITIFVVENSEC
jgi:hypothetical protein